MKENTKELNTKNTQELTMEQMKQVAAGFDWLKPVPHGFTWLKPVPHG